LDTTIRARRSVLYMPGSNARALEKARDLPADGLILDLEDAVAPDAKDLAREQVRAAVSEGGYGNREVVIRINALETPWGQADLEALGNVGAAAILLPKVENPNQVNKLASHLDSSNSAATIWVMAETPRGILNLDAIAGANPRLKVIVMGTSDLAKELRIDPSAGRLGLLVALSQSVLTARAHGLDILDGVHLGLEDNAEFRGTCEQGRTLGFDGKTLIHPRQIATANAAFGISDAQVSRAEAILAAWELARKSGQGVAVLDGKLIEQLHVDEARRALALRAATTD
jgi:citrate lyase subunit beta/citryl-CoA lyase